MSLPKQPLKIDEDRQALAPYNFVELPERVAAVIEGEKLPKVKAQASEQERKTVLSQRNELVTAQLPDQNIFHAPLHSGWIDCRLITASPAYVRAPRTPEEERKRIQSKDLPAFFYEWDKDEPVVPKFNPPFSVDLVNKSPNVAPKGRVKTKANSSDEP